ncbi:MAG: Hsp70 family protein [Pirellulaceae bacterium]|nr:Hsp70 family protein [Pirellulaceae bacterium]
MATTDSSPIVGIDLGTTNSVVAAIVGGRAQVLVEDGEPLLPSVVALDPASKLIVGQAARNGLAAFPERTIASVKRRMGEDVRLPLGDQEFTPQEISAIILRRLRDRAERELGQPVTRAVITVPAFFDEHQRQATREAGKLAGLTVERIINEPTAATLVYRAGSDAREHLVVYDLGGGTFDVSVVRLEMGVVEVLSSKGDTRLGGDDFDHLLMDYVAREFLGKHGIDLREQARTRWRLIQSCERAKRRLSDEYEVRISEEFIAEANGQPLHLDVRVTRDQYEELIRTLVERTIECVDKALRDANLTLNQIDQLVLVGGSTRTPLVQQRLREEFRREPQRAVDPDLAVALGAATQAAMLNGISVGPVLVDVATHTLGIEVLDRMTFSGPELVFSPILHRNSPLPARFEDSYHTVHEKQQMAEIHVLQGEHRDIHRNRSIGKFKLRLQKPDQGDGQILVRFELTLDGTLRVTAVEQASGASEELRIENALADFQSGQRDDARRRLEAMFDHSDDFQTAGATGGWKSIAGHPQMMDLDDAADENEDERVIDVTHTAPAQPVRIAADSSGEAAEGSDEWDELAEIEQLLERAESLAGKLTGEDAEDIEQLASQLRAALAARDQAQVERLCGELDDILFYVQG